MNTAADIFYDVGDVMALLAYSRSKAYKIIAELNRELEGQGKMTRPGMVSKRFFNARFDLGEPVPAGRSRAAK
jgi:hypothetical protein